MKKEMPYKLNLQLHSDGGAENPDDVKDEIIETKEETKTIEEILAEKQKEWQSETDRRVNQALETERKKQEEKERLAKLTEEERIKELEKTKEAEIKERERQLDIKDSKLHIMETLRENNLLDALELFKPEYYLGENKDKLTSDIKALQKIVKGEIEKVTAGVSAQILKGKTPDNPKTDLTPESFKKLSYSEKLKIYNDSPELYHELNK